MNGIQSTPVERSQSVLPEPYGYDGLHLQQNPHLAPETNEGHGFHSHWNGPFTVTYGSDHDKEIHSAFPVQNDTQPSIPRRKIIIWVVISVILVATVVGGVVGGILGKRHKSSTSTSGQDPKPSSPTLNDTASSNDTSSKAVPAPEPMRNIATAQYKVTMFNVWQKQNGDLWMHAYYNEPSKWTKPFKLDTTTPAINNTPLAVVTWQYNDYFEIRVNYTPETQGTPVALNFRCYANGTFCSAPETKSISESRTLVAGVGSFLLSPSLNMLRSYMINDAGLVSEAVYDHRQGNDWRAARPIGDGAKAHKASPLVAGMVNGEIWLFWFDEQKKLQMATCTWTSSLWSQVQNVSTIAPSELPRSLGIAISDMPPAVQLFFLDGTKMQQTRFSNNKWTQGAVGSSIPEASISNGPMSVVGWNDTAVRLFYPVKGSRNIKEVLWESINGVWKVGGMESDIYD